MTDELWERVTHIPGWLTRDEGDILLKYAKSPWCEVGTWVGRSAVVLGQTGPGLAVDAFREGQREEDWRRNTERLPITLIVGDFRDVADQIPDNLEFLYLDADHSYEGTAEAFDMYAPKVVERGYIALHDVFQFQGDAAYPGVYEFYEELLDRGWECVDTAERTAVFAR